MNAIAAYPDRTPRRFLPTAAQGAASNQRHSILGRIFDAIMCSRQRTADRELARFLERSGGHITDEIERRMTEHLMRNTNFWP